MSGWGRIQTRGIVSHIQEYQACLAVWPPTLLAELSPGNRTLGLKALMAQSQFTVPMLRSTAKSLIAITKRGLRVLLVVGPKVSIRGTAGDQSRRSHRLLALMH